MCAKPQSSVCPHIGSRGWQLEPTHPWIVIQVCGLSASCHPVSYTLRVSGATESSAGPKCSYTSSADGAMQLGPLGGESAELVSLVKVQDPHVCFFP